MTELYEKLEREVLPLVSRPSRYTGGERNLPKKDPAEADLSFLLAFPDVYEIGMSHLGIRVLYDILSRRPEIAVERVFAPWVDMEQLMREKDVPLFSVETRTPARDFDAIGFTLQYELHYPEVLTMLDLAGVPLRAADRGELDPFVIGGGPCAFNPEPASAFFDMLAIGDGETVVLDLADLLIDAKRRGAPRADTLRAAADIPGIYVPSLYEASFEDGVFAGTTPTVEGVPPVVRRRVEESLGYLFHPARPIVPVMETTHDRLAVEIMRGCTRGCRFCQAGMVTRPVRECPMEDVARLVRDGIEASGYDEVSLVSLSASDYGGLAELVGRLNETLFDRKVSVSLPSLRADRFGLELADGIGRVRKAGLTFAPEAGSQRLRDVINKNETEESILKTIETAFAAGWSRVKLYFMIGLPTETDDDLEAIIALVESVKERARVHRKGAAISVSVSPFVPKSHTPFQWERQDGIEETRRKEDLLRPLFRIRGVKTALRSPEVPFVEGLLARGGREMCEVIEGAWRRGARFGGWTETFDAAVWLEALEEAGLDAESCLRARPLDAPLPWDHIDAGPSKRFLARERALALEGVVTEDCRLDDCFECGACPPPALAGRRMPEHRTEAVEGAPPEAFGRRRRVREVNGATSNRWRVRYSKRRSARFLSHLDLTRIWSRAVAVSGLPIAYTQGFNPRPRLSFGPPLPVGTTGEAEFVELELVRVVTPSDIATRLSAQLPDGVVIEDVNLMRSKRSASAEACAAEYEMANLAPLDTLSSEELSTRVAAVRRTERVEVPKGEGVKELRPAQRILSLEVTGEGPVTLRVVLDVGSEGALRPVDLVGLLYGGSGQRPELALVHRTALFSCPSSGGLERMG